MILPLLIAQAAGATAEWLAPLGGVGVAGVMLHWFMVRAERRMMEQEKRLVGVENANHRMTRSILLLVMSMETGTTAKEQARTIEKEIADAERRRGPTPEPDEDRP